MADEIEQNPEAEDAVGEARNLYNEYAFSVKETWKQVWKDELLESETDAEGLANFYANEGGDPNQVVYYLENTNLEEKEKWKILAQSFIVRAEFTYEKADDATNKKEAKKLKARVDFYKAQAQTLRRGHDTLK